MKCLFQFLILGIIFSIVEGKEGSSWRTKRRNAPDQQNNVIREGHQNLQIHDVFGKYEHIDNLNVRKLKKDRNFTQFLQLQERSKNAPDQRKKVNEEMKYNIQIHDIFGDLEKQDLIEERKMKRNKYYVALLQENDKLTRKTGKIAPDQSENVKHLSEQNLQIHDVFNKLEKQDEKNVREKKKDKNLTALLQLHQKKRIAPDQSENVKKLSKQNLQIHDVFNKLEKQDNINVRKNKKDKNLTAIFLLQKQQKKIAPDQAYNVKQQGKQNLQIHDVFNKFEKQDDVNVRKNKKDKNLTALNQIAPDQADNVKQQSQENIQIHDVFSDYEKKDKLQERQVKSDKNLAAIQQKKGDWNDIGNSFDKYAQTLKENNMYNFHHDEEESRKEYHTLENPDIAQQEEILRNKTANHEHEDGKVISVSLDSQLQKNKK